MKDKLYCSYGKRSAVFDKELKCFDLFDEKKRSFVRGLHIEKLSFKGEDIPTDRFCVERWESTHGRYGDSGLTVFFNGGEPPVSEFSLSLILTPDEIILRFTASPECVATLSGKLIWGEDPKRHTFPMSSVENGTGLRSAIGPASSTVDNMLFDRLSDNAVCFSGAKSFRMRYNWEESLYDFTLTTGIKAGEHKARITFPENIMAKEYKFNFSPVNKDRVFKKPPAGWMTWYSVGFDASEEKVVENTLWQAENLRDYGADTVWVDWEWCHADYSGESEGGTSSVNPDPVKYPRGLGAVAEEIKKAGFTPALWIGYTNDTGRNEFIDKYPDIVLRDEITWCGRYYYDFTHPDYLERYLPHAVEQVKRWGYEAVKFDTLCDGINMHEEHHGELYDPTLTTMEAFRNMVEKTRKLLGDDCYMLACGPTHAGILWAPDVFDGARVGMDIFEWEEFINEGIIPVMHYYPLHNVTLYADPDNVILSEKYNTYNQAASRIFFVSLLGLPMTFGDVFSTLPKERVELIRRCLPVLDIHPMDIKSHATDKRFLTVNLSVEKPYESYNVVSLINLLEEKAEREVLLTELYLDDGLYHLYDYTTDEYLGVTDRKIDLQLDACETRVVAVRRALLRPQILSTSRHITQGAAEIKEMAWRDDTLSFTSSLVKGDTYRVKIFVPEGYSLLSSTLGETALEENILTLTYTPDKTGDESFTLKFKKD